MLAASDRPIALSSARTAFSPAAAASRRPLGFLDRVSSVSHPVRCRHVSLRSASSPYCHDPRRRGPVRCCNPSPGCALLLRRLLPPCAIPLALKNKTTEDATGGDKKQAGDRAQGHLPPPRRGAPLAKRRGRDPLSLCVPQPPTPVPHTHQARGPSTPRANAHVAVAATHPTSPAGAVRWRSSLEGERSQFRPPLNVATPSKCGR